MSLISMHNYVSAVFAVKLSLGHSSNDTCIYTLYYQCELHKSSSTWGELTILPISENEENVIRQTTQQIKQKRRRRRGGEEEEGRG